MMDRVRERVQQLWVWVLLGSVVGVISTLGVAPYVVPIGIQEYQRQAADFDRLNPIVERIESAILRLDGDAVEVHVVARRVRGECRFDRATGASEDALGRLTPVYIQRLGSGPTGVSYPAGTVTVSEWRLWPVSGAKAVHLIGMYMCDGRPVSETVARVEMPPPDRPISRGD